MGNLSTPDSVQKLQTALHAKAKAEPGYRFYALYDKISREDILAHAYAQWGLHPLERAAFSRRTREADILNRDGEPSSLGKGCEIGFILPALSKYQFARI